MIKIIIYTTIASDDSFVVTGSTYSYDFPTLNAYYPSLSFGRDIFLSKFSSSGDLLFSTFIGGDGDDSAMSLAIDLQGNIFLSGETYSDNFPTLNAFDASYGGFSDVVFVNLKQLFVNI